MKPILLAWLAQYKIPGWLLPDYFTLVGVSALVTAIVAITLAKRDLASLYYECRSLLLVYAAALLGGYALEILQALPSAIEKRSSHPLLHAGRAAYGGLLFSIGVAYIYRRYARQPIGSFLDRLSIGAGCAFFLVRIGCWLAGCDYGRPTTFAFGMRFPASSFAAIDHSQRGWIPTGHSSLPVHPTQLYESMLGLLSMILAGYLLKRLPRNGQTFLIWINIYAVGRFIIEFWRGDVDRGIYFGLSSAQIISILILVRGLWQILKMRTRKQQRDPSY